MQARERALRPEVALCRLGRGALRSEMALHRLERGSKIGGAIEQMGDVL